MGRSPNTALHRTPAAAPLSPVSFQTFGASTPQDPMNEVIWRTIAVAAFALATAACASSTTRIGLAGSAQPLAAKPLSEARLSEVRLERRGCDGPCPIYSVTLKGDGRAVWTGLANVDRRGTYTGAIDFQQVAVWLQSQPTMMNKSEDLPIAVGGEWVVLTMVLRDHTEIVKRFGGGAGLDRLDLWAAAEVVDGIASRVHWEGVSAE